MLTAKIASIQRRLRSGVKFGQLATYHSANLHLLVVPAALVDPAELPVGWGLLELSADGLSLRISPQFLPTQNAQKWLERIAQRATRSWLGSHEGTNRHRERESRSEKYERHESAQASDSLLLRPLLAFV
jgi:hypothetical protein